MSKIAFIAMSSDVTSVREAMQYARAAGAQTVAMALLDSWVRKITSNGAEYARITEALWSNITSESHWEGSLLLDGLEEIAPLLAAAKRELGVELGISNRCVLMASPRTCIRLIECGWNLVFLACDHARLTYEEALVMMPARYDGIMGSWAKEGSHRMYRFGTVIEDCSVPA